MRNGDIDEGERLRGLLHGARGVGAVVPVLAKAATAILEAGEALESIALDLSQIGSDTARAISDTVAMKQYLKTVAAREVGMRRDLDAVKLEMARRRSIDKAKSIGVRSRASRKGRVAKTKRRKSKQRV
jgi:hypothetical protein